MKQDEDLIRIAAAFLDYIEFAEVDTNDEGCCRRPDCPVCRWDADEHHADCEMGKALKLARKILETDE